MNDESLTIEAEKLGQTLVPVAEAHTPGRVNRDLVAAIGAAGMFDRVFRDGQVTALELCQI
ncbi:MAG: hypothetical protein PVF87_12360, partial [Acidimicrobiia bacterium]